MKVCDQCQTKIDAPAFCDAVCKMRYRRVTKQGNSVTPEEHNGYSPVTNEEEYDDYQLPVSNEDDSEWMKPCKFCNKKYTVNEDGNVYCRKCKQGTFYNVVEE